MKTKKSRNSRRDDIENGLGLGHLIRCFTSSANFPHRGKQFWWIWELPPHSMTDNIHREVFFQASFVSDEAIYWFVTGQLKNISHCFRFRTALEPSTTSPMTSSTGHTSPI